MKTVDQTLMDLIEETKQLEAEFNAKFKAIEKKYNVKMIVRSKSLPINVCIDANVATMATPC